MYKIKGFSIVCIDWIVARVNICSDKHFSRFSYRHYSFAALCSWQWFTSTKTHEATMTHQLFSITCLKYHFVHIFWLFLFVIMISLEFILSQSYILYKLPTISKIWQELKLLIEKRIQMQGLFVRWAKLIEISLLFNSAGMSIVTTLFSSARDLMKTVIFLICVRLKNWWLLGKRNYTKRSIGNLWNVRKVLKWLTRTSHD